jgi:hypothetical protein
MLRARALSLLLASAARAQGGLRVPPVDVPLATDAAFGRRVLTLRFVEAGEDARLLVGHRTERVVSLGNTSMGNERGGPDRPSKAAAERFLDRLVPHLRP